MERRIRGRPKKKRMQDLEVDLKDYVKVVGKFTEQRKMEVHLERDVASKLVRSMAYPRLYNKQTRRTLIRRSRPARPCQVERDVESLPHKDTAKSLRR